MISPVLKSFKLKHRPLFLRQPTNVPAVSIETGDDYGDDEETSHTLNFLRRNLKYCPKQSKQIAYFAMVRSTLKYSCAMCDPHLYKDIDSVERVNGKAAWFMSGDR